MVAGVGRALPAKAETTSTAARNGHREESALVVLTFSRGVELPGWIYVYTLERSSELGPQDVNPVGIATTLLLFALPDRNCP
jgi:hypothetical protein